MEKAIRESGNRGSFFVIVTGINHERRLNYSDNRVAMMMPACTVLFLEEFWMCSLRFS